MKKKQMDRDVRHKRLLILWAILAVVMASAITATSVGIVISQVKTDRDQAVDHIIHLFQPLIIGIFALGDEIADPGCSG